MPKTTAEPAPWGHRFADLTVQLVDPEQLLANPMNARRHPADQREALRESLGALGWVTPVLVNTTTDRLVDGHARVEEAITKGAPVVPVLYIAVSEDEEARILATLDPIGALAAYDAEIARDLMATFMDDESATADMLTRLIADLPEVNPDDDDYGNVRLGLTPKDRHDDYVGENLRSIILVYPSDEYDEVSALFTQARDALGVESNAAAVMSLLRNAVPEG